MAPFSSKRATIFFLLLLISSLHIEARVGKFYNSNIAPQPQPPQGSIFLAPSEGGFGPAPVPSGIAPAPDSVESTDDNPYGLHNIDPTHQFFPRKTTTTTTSDNEEDEILADEIANEKLGVYDVENQYFNNNNPYSNNYDSNNYEYPNSGNYNYNNGGGVSSYDNYDNNGYELENNDPEQQKGMSDTRFLESGKYYYDVPYNENGEAAGKKVINGYESAKENSFTEGNNYYGYGENSKYKFDTMEEYERQQGYPDTDKLYNP